MPAQSDILITPVDSDALLDEFIRLPWQVQQNDPAWVPPTLSKQKKVLSRDTGPFFEIGDAQLFLARRDGRATGRISAHVNRLHDSLHDPGDGFFGFFECSNDQATATALFEAAAGWLRSRGKKKILGPLSFSIYDDVGLLVEGFDSTPAILLTHNPSYYETLVSNWGFRKAIDWYALKITNRNVDVNRMAEELKRLMGRNNGLVLTAPTPTEVLNRADDIFKLFNEAWKSNWGHIPFTRKQFTEVLKELKPVLRSDLIRVVKAGDEIVAFIITIPDINGTIRKLNGRMNLLDQLRLLVEARWQPLRRVKTVLLGVQQKYQRKRLHEAMILDTYVHLVRNQPELEFCDCSLIPEHLGFYMRLLGRYGAERYKTYRIFEKEI